MRRLIISIVLTLLLTVWAHRLYLTEAGFDGKLFIIIITLAYRFVISWSNIWPGLRLLKTIRGLTLSSWFA